VTGGLDPLLDTRSIEGLFRIGLMLLRELYLKSWGIDPRLTFL